MRPGVSLLLALLLGAAHAAELDDELGKCRAVSDDAARLACYDALATPAKPPAPPAAPAPVTEPVAAEAALPVPEDLGAEALPGKPEKKEPEKEKETFSATVTRCTENVDGRYVFYFENGQVWKQAKDNRLYFRECRFDVTITKDFFGYKMQQVGEKKRIRIKRVR